MKERPLKLPIENVGCLPFTDVLSRLADGDRQKIIAFDAGVSAHRISRLVNKFGLNFCRRSRRTSARLSVMDRQPVDEGSVER